jgi:hypothetical protein
MEKVIGIKGEINTAGGVMKTGIIFLIIPVFICRLAIRIKM